MSSPTLVSIVHLAPHCQGHLDTIRSLSGKIIYICIRISFIPDGLPCLQVLEHCHDARMARHIGIAKSMELVKPSFWWPHLCQIVKDYLCTCDICCRAKMPRHHPYGLLQPLSTPNKPLGYKSTNFAGFWSYFNCNRSIYQGDTFFTLRKEHQWSRNIKYHHMGGILPSWSSR
jgi:hypothetical protein